MDVGDQNGQNRHHYLKIVTDTFCLRHPSPTSMPTMYVVTYNVFNFRASIDPDLKLLKAILSQFVINLGSQKLDLKNEQGFFMCPEENCNYNSVHVTHVKDHFKTHSGEQPFQCKICLMKFKYKQSCKGWFSSSSGY